MLKTITLKLETSEIIQNDKPQVGFGLEISDTCAPEDVRIMAGLFMNWYLQNGVPPQPGMRVNPN